MVIAEFVLAHSVDGATRCRREGDRFYDCVNCYAFLGLTVKTMKGCCAVAGRDLRWNIYEMNHESKNIG